MSNVVGVIKVLEVVENKDGTCTVHVDIPDDFPEIYKTAMDEEFNEENFSIFVNRSLKLYIENNKKGESNGE